MTLKDGTKVEKMLLLAVCFGDGEQFTTTQITTDPSDRDERQISALVKVKKFRSSEEGEE